MADHRHASQSDRQKDPETDSEIDGGTFTQAIRQHPVIVSVLVGCTLAGAALGFALLTGDWSAPRRIAAGAVAGAGVGMLVAAPRMIG